MVRSVFTQAVSDAFDLTGTAFENTFETLFDSPYVTHYDGFDSFYLDHFANTLVNNHYFSRSVDPLVTNARDRGVLSNLELSGRAEEFTRVTYDNANAIESVKLAIELEAPASQEDANSNRDRSELLSHRYMDPGRSFAYAFNVKFDFDGRRGSDADWLNIVQIKSVSLDPATVSVIPVRLALYTDDRGESYLTVRVNGNGIGEEFYVNGQNDYAFRVFINQAETLGADDPSALRVEVTDLTKQALAQRLGADAPDPSTYTHHWDLSESVFPRQMGLFDTDGNAFANYLRIGAYRQGIDEGGDLVAQKFSATFTEFEALAASDHAQGGTSVVGTSQGEDLGAVGGIEYRDSDRIFAAGGDDRIFGGYADDLLYGQGGSDLIYGGAQDDAIFGGAENDLLYGDAGQDTLRGDAGDDTLSGGAGDDVLRGGAGADVYYYAKGGGFDRVSGFDASQGDQLHLGISRSVFQQNVRYVNGDVQITLGSDDKLFLYDVSAAELNGNVVFGVQGVGRPQDWNGNDTYSFDAGFGSDTIAFNQTIAEGEFDQIRFGKGLDAADVSVSIQKGDAVLRFDTGEELTITDHFDEDKRHIDRIVFGDGEIWYPWKLEASIESGTTEIFGNSRSDSIEGTAFDDIIWGYRGLDFLAGGEGNDTLVGGTGSDYLNGGSGNDTYKFNVGDGVDYIYPVEEESSFDQIVYGEGISPDDISVSRISDGAWLTNIATQDSVLVIGQFGAASDPTVDRIVFDNGTIWYPWKLVQLTTQVTNGNNFIAGDESDEVLIGLAGNDVIEGHAGNDTLIGGTDNDTLYGGGGSDTYFFEGNFGNDLTNDSQYGFQNISTDFDQIVFGEGWTPEDATVRRNDLDLVIQLGSNSVSVSSFFLTESTEIGRVKFADDTIWYPWKLKQLAGQTAATEIETGGTIYRYARGDDEDYFTNRPSDGAAKLHFGIGISPDDITAARSGNDLFLIDSVTGNKIEFNENFAADDFYDEGSVFSSPLTGIAFADGTFWDEETLNALIKIGDARDNYLYGDASNEVLSGQAGGDNIWGRGGDDSLNGGDGNDALRGDTGDDLLEGGAGNDDIKGEAGDDTLIGGSGNDVLTGREGNDIYLFDAGFGQDRIESSSYGHLEEDGSIGGFDRIIFSDAFTPEDATVTRQGNALVIYMSDGSSVKLSVQVSYAQSIKEVEFADGTIWDFDTLFAMSFVPNAYDNTLYGTQEADLIDGLAGADVISGEAGDDTLLGGIGNDRLFGGEGDDHLEGGDANDHLQGGDGNDTYIFNAGFGADTIRETGQAASGEDWFDQVVFGAGISPDDLTIDRNSSDELILAHANGTGLLNVRNQFVDETAAVPNDYAIEEFSFADGTVWTAQYLRDVLSAVSAGDDDVHGTRQNDIIRSLDGDDTIVTWAGNDIINPGSGNNYINAGHHNDTVTFYDAVTGVHVNLAQGTAELDVYTSTLFWVENVTGTSQADMLIGDGETNILRGLYGEDQISGGGGDDHITGGGSNDTITGGAGFDRVYFSGARDEYTITEQGGYTWVDRIASGGDATDRLFQIEMLVFSDQDVLL